MEAPASSSFSQPELQPAMASKLVFILFVTVLILILLYQDCMVSAAYVKRTEKQEHDELHEGTCN